MNLRDGDTVGRSVPISRQDVAVEALFDRQTCDSKGGFHHHRVKQCTVQAWNVECQLLGIHFICTDIGSITGARDIPVLCFSVLFGWIVV